MLAICLFCFVPAWITDTVVNLHCEVVVGRICEDIFCRFVQVLNTCNFLQEIRSSVAVYSVWCYTCTDVLASICIWLLCELAVLDVDAWATKCRAAKVDKVLTTANTFIECRVLDVDASAHVHLAMEDKAFTTFYYVIDVHPSILMLLMAEPATPFVSMWMKE